MFKGYTRDWSWERALILMYSAKKRAEVSPGVGRYTDFFTVDRSGFSPFSEAFVRELDNLLTDFEAVTKTKWDEMAQRLIAQFDAIERPKTPPS